MDEKMLRAGGEAKRKELITQFEYMQISGDKVDEMTASDQKVAKQGDYKQAEGLLEQKAARQKKQ